MAVTTQGHWFGPSTAPLLGWVTSDRGLAATSGVLLVPPMGYETWTAHRTLRSLAEALAADGHLVLRFDLRGTGDSALDTWEVTSIEDWQTDVRTAAAELRSLGAERVSLVGLRMGALLAMATADAADPPDAARPSTDAGPPGATGPSVVAWWPPASARAHLRELSLLGERPAPACDPAGGGSVFVAGVAITRGLASTAAVLDPAQALVRSPGHRVVILDRDDRPSADSLERALRDEGVEVERTVVAGANAFLGVATEHAVVPQAPLETIVDHLRPRRASAGRLDAGACVQTVRRLATAATLPFHGRSIVERVVEVGADRLVAIETLPADPAPCAATANASMTIVFLNSGSEHHVGPGRSWVEFARALALEGHRSLRVDYRGWGESPDSGHAPGRPFDPHTVDDTARLVEALGGGGPVVLVGLCAGAWSALRHVERLSIAGMLALNPPLYWQPGDPIEATMAETRIRVERERPREERLARWHVWDLANILRLPIAGARWLGRIAAAPFPVWFVCTQDDDGREYLHQRLARPLARARRSASFRLVELERLDHSMHRQWHRDELLEQLRSLLTAAAQA